jgi:hypothetical protein
VFAAATSPSLLALEVSPLLFSLSPTGGDFPFKGSFQCAHIAYQISHILPPSLKESISRVVLSQSFQILTDFIGKSIKIYNIKLVSLDVSYNIFS